jgi:CheY-like chemotaxis protein
MAMKVNPPIETPITRPKSSNGRPRRSLSVLIVDDEPAFCFAMAEILSLSGHEVHQAHSVSQALDLLSQFTPDLILTDIMMPGSDGLAFIRHLRSRTKWADIPTIAVSAKAMNQDRVAAQEAGADGYLAKPFSAQELQATILAYSLSDATAA